MPDNPHVTEVHVSSLVVHVRPECRADAMSRIVALSGAEIHGASDSGKLVVVLETASEADILSHIALINEMPGIVATSLVYHEIDTALPEESQYQGGATC